MQKIHFLRYQKKDSPLTTVTRTAKPPGNFWNDVNCNLILVVALVWYAVWISQNTEEAASILLTQGETTPRVWSE